MKLQIVRKILFLILLVILYNVQVFGQGVSSSNPIEYTAIGEGEALLSKQIKQQQHCLDTLFVLQGGIVYSQTKMKNWEQKYNSYLKTAQGFASSIKAATTLYAEGMQTLSALWEIKTACKLNPQGIASSISMNNLYAETAVELVKTYRLLKKVVAGEGEDHMLNGAERTKILWQLNSEIEQLNKKFRALALSISLYSFEDVWNRAIAGKIQKSNKTLAEEARKRQSRAMKIVAKFYKERQNSKPWGW